MFRRKKNREVPQLNTTSTAELSFMLLIFFLVTSSMDTDKGLTSQMPPPEDTTEQQEQEVKKRNVMELQIDAADVLTCNGETISYDELTNRVEDFVANVAMLELEAEHTRKEKSQEIYKQHQQRKNDQRTDHDRWNSQFFPYRRMEKCVQIKRCGMLFRFSFPALFALFFFCMQVLS